MINVINFTPFIQTEIKPEITNQTKKRKQKESSWTVSEP